MSINSKSFIIFFLFYTLASSKYVEYTKAELVTAVHVVRRLSGSCCIEKRKNSRRSRRVAVFLVSRATPCFFCCCCICNHEPVRHFLTFWNAAYTAPYWPNQCISLAPVTEVLSFFLFFFTGFPSQWFNCSHSWMQFIKFQQLTVASRSERVLQLATTVPDSNVWTLALLTD